jgi:hypothetical protein
VYVVGPGREFFAALTSRTARCPISQRAWFICHHDLMPRFETEMEVCPDCRRTTEATVEYIRDSDGNVIKRLVRDINCRYADCPGSEVPPHWG